nr:putative reverse transcriptase domain-containing protein [Tanacetum cinerariifolium]
MDWEDDKYEEPEEALLLGFDMGMDWEDVDDEEPKLIFPYQAEGPPYPLPHASPNIELVADIMRFQALSAAQEITRVENIRLRRELEEARMSNTLLRQKELLWKNLLIDRVAEAIAEHERNRPNPAIAGGSENVQGYSHKTFMDRKPHPFNGTKGVVGLRCWTEKIEHVFEISKCAKGDKVMFSSSTFEGCALTWWNENVPTLRHAKTNSIPWNEFKTMMTIEYCLATEIQRMKQEL